MTPSCHADEAAGGPFDGEEAQKQGRALSVLGLDKDIESIAQDDHIGRALQDQSLLERKKPEP